MKNISREEAAKAGIVSIPAYSSYEEARAYPKCDTLIRLADYYAVTVDNLVRSDLSALQSANQ